MVTHRNGIRQSSQFLHLCTGLLEEEAAGARFSRGGANAGLTRSLLISGPEIEAWAEQCRAMIDFYADASGLSPLMLLPDDIQLEDYEPFYEVVWGDEAGRVLGSHCGVTAMGEAPGARLVCIDLFPALFPEPEWIMAALTRIRSQGGVTGSCLLVFTTSPSEALAALFDEHLQLEDLSR